MLTSSIIVESNDGIIFFEKTEELNDYKINQPTLTP